MRGKAIMTPFALLCLGLRAKGSCTIFIWCSPSSVFHRLHTLHLSPNRPHHLLFINLFHFNCPHCKSPLLLDFHDPLVEFHWAGSFCSSPSSALSPQQLILTALLSIPFSLPIFFHLSASSSHVLFSSLCSFSSSFHFFYRSSLGLINWFNFEVWTMLVKPPWS